MGFPLYREVRDFAPADLTQSELTVALMIADDANDVTRESWIPNPLLCARTRLTPRALRDALQKLGARGLEFRVIHGYGKDGRPVFAARGHSVDYLVPDLIKGSTLMPPLPVDNSSKGSTLMPPNETQRRHADVPKAAPERPKAALSCRPSPQISSVSPQAEDHPVVTTSVEGNGLSTGQRRMSEIELAAWQAAESRRQRETKETHDRN